MKGNQWKNNILNTEEGEGCESIASEEKLLDNGNDKTCGVILDKNKNVRQKPALLPKPQIPNNNRRTSSTSCKKSQSSTQTVTIKKTLQTSAGTSHGSTNTECVTTTNISSSEETSQSQVHSISSTLAYFQGINSVPITPPKRGCKNILSSKPISPKPELPPKTVFKSGLRGSTLQSTNISPHKTQTFSSEYVEIDTCKTDTCLSSTALTESKKFCNETKQKIFSPKLYQEFQLKKFDKLIRDINAPIRPPRSPRTKSLKNGPFDVAHDTSWANVKRKSASLARTENLQWIPKEINKNSKYPIRYLQESSRCSRPITRSDFVQKSVPIPHPRHKSKLKLQLELDLALRSLPDRLTSVEASLPIYATVDYSKKKNRRGTAETETPEFTIEKEEGSTRSSSSIDSFKSVEDLQIIESKPTFLRTFSEPVGSCVNGSFSVVNNNNNTVDLIVNDGEDSVLKTRCPTDMDNSRATKNKSLLYGDILINKTDSELDAENDSGTTESLSTLCSNVDITADGSNNVPSDSTQSTTIGAGNNRNSEKDGSLSFLHGRLVHPEVEKAEEEVEIKPATPTERKPSFLHQISNNDMKKIITSTPKIEVLPDKNDSKGESFYDCEESQLSLDSSNAPGLSVLPDKDVTKERNRTYLVKKDNDNLTETDPGIYSSKRLGTWLGSFGKGHRKNKNLKERCTSQFYTQTPNECDVDLNDRNRTISLPDIKNTGKETYVFTPLKQQEELEGNSSAADTISNCSEISSSLQHSESEDEVDPQDQYIPTDVKEKKAFLKARELMTSEAVLIDVLKLLNVDFRQYVERSSDSKQRVIPEADLHKILNHLPQLQVLNEDLHSDIKQRIANWRVNPKVADVIVRKGPFLKLYTTYIQNFETQCSYLEDCCVKYPRFAKVVKDFESTDRCKKLTLRFYMLKPVQRITQYKMLLSDYMKYLNESSIDYADTMKALSIVSDVADHANRSMKHGDRVSRMMQLQSQLGDYQLIQPGRELIKEGELDKLCRKTMQARYFILLNDSLLYTSYYGSMTSLRVNHCLPISGMKVTCDSKDDHHNTFTIMSVTKSFILRAKTEMEKLEWVEALQYAIKDYNQRQMSFHNTKPSDKQTEEMFKLGKRAPVWIQDNRVTMCQICTSEFTALFRRHHCRACGKVVCGKCSENEAPLEYRHFKASRVCEDCFDFLREEFDNKNSIIEVLRLNEDSKDPDVLDSIYHTLRSRFVKSESSGSWKKKKFIPPRLKEVSAKDSGSLMKGWLHRKSKRSWKLYWFVLKDPVLYVYKACEDVVAVESIPLLGYKVESLKHDVDDNSGKQLFQLLHPTQPPMVFHADTEENAHKWIEAMKEATVLK